MKRASSRRAMLHFAYHGESGKEGAVNAPAPIRLEGFEAGELWSLRQVIEFKAKPFIDAQDILVQMSLLMHSEDNRFFPNVHDIHKNDLRRHVGFLINQFDDLHLSLCKKAAERLLLMLDRTSSTRELVSYIDDLRRRLIDQMEIVFCLFLDEGDKKLYDCSSTIFGDEVNCSFPMLLEDISEASKCLALHRYTACVFHLMRAMEGSVQALSAKLGIQNTSREWGKLLADIKPIIESMKPGDMRNAWSETFSLLYHVKQSWRNDTMHPKQTYTEDEARAIFSAVNAFMKSLASLV